MTRGVRSICVVAIALLPLVLYAEQEITLKSGAVIVGTAKIDGDAVVVEVDEAPLRVPLAEVATIASVDTSNQRHARQLLLTALEAKLTNDAGKEVIGILAEASRLAPDDPHIAYWYAASLADAGFGQAAKDVLERRREQIATAYPGLANELVARIARRVEMEQLPPALVHRLDELNVDAARQSSDADMRKLFAMFRLVDQHDRAIERPAFRVICNEQNEKLESFDDGYHIFTFNKHRNSDEQTCRVEVARPGLESNTFEFSASPNRIENAGDFKVRRYQDDAKKTFKLHVLGPEGQPIPGAHVTLQALSPRGSGSVFTRESETGADGNAEFQEFPMKYSYSVHAEGFNFENGNVELKLDAQQPEERTVSLYREITGTIRFAWVATPFQNQGAGKMNGEATIRISGRPRMPGNYGPDATPWIKPVQVKDKLTLQFIDMPFGYVGPFGSTEAWLRVIEPEAGARDKFASLDLTKIETLKEELPEPDIGRSSGEHGPMSLPAELKKIYVGKLQNRDLRTGQPVQLAVKVMVEKMASETAAEE